MIIRNFSCATYREWRTWYMAFVLPVHESCTRSIWALYFKYKYFVLPPDYRDWRKKESFEGKQVFNLNVLARRVVLNKA